MQGQSFIVVGGILFVALLVIGLAFGWAGFAALLAMLVFLVAFGIYLVKRGKERARTEQSSGTRRVPTTEEAAADPVWDSSMGDAVRARNRQSTPARDASG